MFSERNLKRLANTPVTKQDEESPKGQRAVKEESASFWRDYYGIDKDN